MRAARPARRRRRAGRRSTRCAGRRIERRARRRSRRPSPGGAHRGGLGARSSRTDRRARRSAWRAPVPRQRRRPAATTRRHRRDPGVADRSRCCRRGTAEPLSPRPARPWAPTSRSVHFAGRRRIRTRWRAFSSGVGPKWSSLRAPSIQVDAEHGRASPWTSPRSRCVIGDEREREGCVLVAGRARGPP